MNKTIICVGCSWTYGHGLLPEHTFPAHLQDLLKDYTVINAGHCGADISYAIFSAVRLIEEYNPEFIIFQLTTFDRITLGFDGYENFLSDTFYDGRDDQIYFENTNQEYRRVIGISHNTKTKITHGTYLNLDTLPGLTKQERKIINKNFISILVENVLHSNYFHQKLYNELFLFQTYLNHKNIKSLFFYWIFHQDKFKKNFNSELFDTKNLIDISVKEWFEKTYPTKNFYIDNGFHLSNEGNKILAEHFLLPYIKKIL